jgi:hypothetical protein
MDILRPALFLGYALSLGTRRNRPTSGTSNLAMNSPSAASRHPEKMVRFSRLLGKFDTTARATSVQVEGVSTVTNSGNRRDICPECTKCRIRGMRHSAFPCWSLASQQIVAGGMCSTVPIARRLPVGIPLYQGRSLAGLLPGACFFVGWPE